MGKKLTTEKPNVIVFKEEKNSNFEKLIEIYKQDKSKARVIFHTNKKNNGFYTKEKLVCFEYSNGDFRIVKLLKSIGISVNGIMYNKEANLLAIIYKKLGNKFYYSNNKHIRGLQLNDLHSFFHDKSSGVYEYLVERFGWLRNVNELSKTNHLFNTTLFNVITNKKLYNDKAMVRKTLNCPYPVGKILMESNLNLKEWKEIKKHLINIENMKLDFISNQYFRDTCKLAAALGRKVNCSWSDKRLKLEHNKWAKEVVNIILEFEEYRELKINQIFLDFGKFSGYEVLTSNFDLIEEGKKMSHCVGMYSGEVDAGRSCIYRRNGYTLELRRSGNTLHVGQYKDFDNDDVPFKELADVKDIISDFNEINKENKTQYVMDYDDNNPF